MGHVVSGQAALFHVRRSQTNVQDDAIFQFQKQDMHLNGLNRDMFKPFRSHRRCSDEFLVVCLRICTGFNGVSFRETHLWDRQTKLLS